MFEILEFAFYIFSDIMKCDGVAVVHVVEFLRAGGSRYYRPGNDVCQKAYAKKEEEHYHYKPDHYRIYIEIMGDAATYATKYFVVWVAEEAIV